MLVAATTPTFLPIAAPTSVVVDAVVDAGCGISSSGVSGGPVSESGRLDVGHRGTPAAGAGHKELYGVRLSIVAFRRVSG